MTTSLLILRPFAECDWYGFSGAERFADGSAPLIGATTVDDVPATIVVDAGGISLYVGEEGDDEYYYTCPEAEVEAVKDLVRAMAWPTTIDSDRLLEMGFRAR